MTSASAPKKRFCNKMATPKARAAAATKSSDSRIRLQRFLSQCGVASRRHSEEIIAEGRVQVNGKTVTTLGTTIDPDIDRVKLDGKLLVAEENRIFAFHKPKGVVTTLADPHAKRDLTHYLADAPVRLYPIGRLDTNVFGLLLLTNNGEYATKMAHPRFEVPHSYWARVERPVTDAALKKLVRGVKLEDGVGVAQRAEALSLTAPVRRLFRLGTGGHGNFVSLTVAEGRKHFVKRILAEVGLPVMELCRVSFGPYKLGSLATGDFREEPFRKLESARKS